MFMDIKINIDLSEAMESEMEKILAEPNCQAAEAEAIRKHSDTINRLVDDSIDDALAALKGAGYVAVLE